MEQQQMALFAGIDARSVVTTVSVQTDYDRGHVLVMRYGEKISLRIDQGHIAVTEGYRLVASYSDGISAILGLSEHQAETLRNAGFAAADYTRVSLEKDREDNAC